MMYLSSSTLLAVVIAVGQAVHAAGLSPEESRKHFTPADGLEVTLAAAEPELRQPVNVNFDARGRMWVVQYLQYPKPAGLKPIAVDSWLRTTYDQCPMPPPYGPKGADRITIFEDPDEHGHYRKSKDFVSGLNLATSVEFGHGGVWVLQTPYLLFYPDRDGDDVPDGPPEVRLAGFGMEDAHAVANHLTWGPDGWLYGCQGSTCTARVRGEEFQQAAWRYHPLSKQFEVFSEGGGNTFGLEWDPHGNLLTGTNYNNYVMVHYVQGGYFIKGFAKHGPLHNPYAFGYFDHVPHTGWRGGHVTQLGLIYQGGALPADRFDGKWIAPNLLTNEIDTHVVRPVGSSFKTEFEGVFLGSTDPCFRPVDVRTGPDGAVYVADWYDRRANHVIPEDTWDKETGRVWRVGPKGLAPAAPFDLSKEPSEGLVKRLTDPNDWYARMARRILAERRDAAVIPILKAMAREGDGRTALQALWALYVSGGLDDTTAADLLRHRNADVRAWTVRLLGDAKQVAPSMRDPLVALAKSDPSPVVRSQLACSARRLPAGDALPILRELSLRDEDAGDRYIPLLIWWAVERQVSASPDGAGEVVAALFDAPGAWKAAIVRKTLLERVARRLAAEPTATHLESCAKLLAAAPSREDADKLLTGMDLGLQGTSVGAIPEPLRDAVERRWRDGRPGPALVRVALRLRLPSAHTEAVKQIGDPQVPPSERASLARALGEAGDAKSIDTLLPLVGASQPKEVRLAAIAALGRFDDPRVAPGVLGPYAKMPADLRASAASLLVGRPVSARALVDSVEAGRVAPDLVPPDAARRLLLHHDPRLDAAVAKFWASARPASEEEKVASTARVRQVLADEPAGDAARGRQVFLNTCGKCHAVRGEGARLGPDLTGFARGHVDYLIANTIDPNAVIRPEYATYIVKTRAGEVLEGAMIDTGETVTVDDGQTRTAVPRDQVLSAEPSPVSRMPEKLLDGMRPQEVRDLFAFLTS